MGLDRRLSRMLHVLVHMDHADDPLTSEAIAEMLRTNSVVVRRTLGQLREHGYVTSTKGHGGGWVLAKPLAQISMLDIYHALGEPEIFALGLSQDTPGCAIEKSVNLTLSDSLESAEKQILHRFKELKLSQLSKAVAGKMPKPKR